MEWCPVWRVRTHALSRFVDNHDAQRRELAIVRQMHSRQAVLQTVLPLARAQGGVVSRPQMLGLGLSRKLISRLVADGSWGRLEPGIYLVPDVEPSWVGLVWAGVLIGGPDARACGLTAASLAGLTDDQPRPIQIITPNGMFRVDRPWVQFRQEANRVRKASSRADPPRTRIEDTVLDLCAAGSRSGCVDWVTRAVQRRLTSPEALQAAVNRRARVPHRRFMTGLLTDVATGVHSTLEYRYLHDVERAHDLPTARRQRPRPGAGEFIDAVYEDFGVVVELDGRIGHVAEGQFRDRRRDNRHTRTARPSLRYGWSEVSGEPCGVATEVAEVLIGRGWGGYPSTCGRCLRPGI